jgi:hypothetical protein
MSSPQKISQLTTAGPLTGAELVPIVQNGGTLQTTVSNFVALANVSLLPVVSALQTQINQVSALASANAAAITSTNAVVSTLTTRVATVSAVTSVNAAAITSINDTVSALEVRVSSVSATGVANSDSITSINAVVSLNTEAITSVNAVISALDVRVSILEAAVSNIGDVSAIAGLVSNVAVLEGDVSALTIRVAAVSASVSALQIQLNAVSALTSVNAAAITSVNAVVSTKVNRVGDFMDSVQYIEFDTSSSITVSVGRLSWNPTHGTLDLGLIGGNANLLIGQREVVYCFNNSAATLVKGKVVKVVGSSGQRLTVDLAQADSDMDSATILGIMLEDVSVNASGFVATDGVVNNVNTGGFTDGQIVYLSPVSAGELTAIKPIAPQHLVQMGYIVKGGSIGAGSVYIKVQNGYEIGELHDVKTSSSTSLADGEVLAYNTSAGVWTNSTALLDTQASVSALNIQVAAVSALTSANAAAIAAVSALVSGLDVRVAAVSASVSALQVQLDTVSAALTSVNNTVSALEIRVSTVSAQASAIQTQVDAVSAAVSAVLVSVGQRVLKAGDTMSGELNMADNLVTRPKFKDYALTAVIKGSVSATTTLDMTEGNFFTALIAGSTTFVFANPPVSAANGPAAGGFVLELQNGASATITWPTAVDWPGGVAPALTATGYDVLVFITDDGGTVWRGVLSMKDSK